MAYETVRERKRETLLKALPEESWTAVLERLWLLWE